MQKEYFLVYVFEDKVVIMLVEDLELKVVFVVKRVEDLEFVKLVWVQFNFIYEWFFYYEFIYWLYFVGWLMDLQDICF